MPACQPRLSIAPTAQSPPHLLNIGGEPQFLNGINLAWVRFPDFVGTGAGSSSSSSVGISMVSIARNYIFVAVE